MTHYEFFEAMMLVCFSISWYWSIARMLQIRAAVGKSTFFVMLICAGYTLGIASKVFLWSETGEISPLVWLYCWNLIVTGIDLGMVIYFSRPRQIA